MSIGGMADVAAALALTAAPAIVVAAPRDIPNRAAPGAYVATVQEPAQFTFVDVMNVSRPANGQVTAHVYMVEAAGQDINGQASPFQAYQITYDCVAGAMHLDQVDYVNEGFGLIATLAPPPDFKAWSISDKPDLAVAYGFHEICDPGRSRAPRLGRGEPWTALAASMRSKLAPQ